MTDGYEVFERFCIISENEGDEKAFEMIEKMYGRNWLKWLKEELKGGRK